jgi:type II secretory pathway component PulK
MTYTRRGVILPVVLLVLVLLGLLGAMFSFRVNADLASTQAMAYRLQTRLAAEAGIDRAKLLLRESRYDIDRWYHNPDELHRIITWTPDGSRSVWGTNDELEEDSMAYRFSIVADDPTDDENHIIRLGISDEASKLNLNTATEAQLMILVTAAVDGDQEIVPKDIVDAILDWRDQDRKQNGEKKDTEGEYYKTLPKPYRVKNGPFDTVEELLLVKGVTGQILYGEDWDRNGLLTPNEDDGADTFPLDNENGELNRGLYPYLTVHSSEENVSNANRPRVYLLGPDEPLRAELEDAFPDDPQIVDFIVSATRGRGAAEGAAGQGGNSNTGNGGAPGAGEAQNGVPGIGSEDNEEIGTLEGGLDGSDESDEGNEMAGTNTDQEQESDNAQDELAPIRSPASLLSDNAISVEVGKNPLTAEHLPILLNRTTTLAPDQPSPRGLININTAPRLVLRCIADLTEDQVEAILETRERLSSEMKETTAWLLTEEVVDLATFELVAPVITARGQQFTIESLGYGDHVGMVTRLQVVVDLVGPIAQTIYYRDLTYLGGHYPIREEDLERVRAR